MPKKSPPQKTSEKSPEKKSVKFVTPPNMLKTKVGSGGLSEQILKQAERLLESNSIEFEPIAEMYLADLYKAIDRAGRASRVETDDVLYDVSYPVTQLRANGKMFQYELITRMAEKFLHFLKLVKNIDSKALEIMQAFHTSMTVVLQGKIKGDGGTEGRELLNTLIRACDRYQEKTRRSK